MSSDDPIDELEVINKEIYRIRSSDTAHMFERRKWFVKEKLEPGEEEAARQYQQEALDDAAGGAGNRTQKQSSIIPILRPDPNDPSLFLVDTEERKKQQEQEKEQQEQETESEPFIQISLIDMGDGQKPVISNYDEIREKVHQLVKKRLLFLQKEEDEKNKEQSSPDLISWDQVEGAASLPVVMSSITVEEFDTPQEALPLPSRAELKKQLFGNFSASNSFHMGNLNVFDYLVEDGVYEYEDDEEDNDSGCFYESPPQIPPVRQAFQEYEDHEDSDEERPDTPQRKEEVQASQANLQTGNVFPPQQQTDHCDRFQYLTDDEDADERVDVTLAPRTNAYPREQDTFFTLKLPEYMSDPHPGPLGTVPQMTTQDNLKAFHRLRNPVKVLPNGENFLRLGFPFIQSGIPDSNYGMDTKPTPTLFQKLAYHKEVLIDEVYNFDLFTDSFTWSSVSSSIGLLFLLLTVFIGELLEAPLSAITCLWVATAMMAKTVTQELYRGFRLFKHKRKYRQQLRKSRPHLCAWMAFHTNDPPDLKPNEEGKNTPSPEKGTTGLRVSKPDGVVSHNPKKKKISIDKIQISEARCNLVEDRPFLPVMLGGKLEQMALVDSGAMCSSISPSLLAKLEEVMPVPREKRSFHITGVVQDATSHSDEVAIISYTVSSG